jgi:hypothetical protein
MLLVLNGHLHAGGNRQKQGNRDNYPNTMGPDATRGIFVCWHVNRHKVLSLRKKNSASPCEEAEQYTRDFRSLVLAATIN